MSYDTAFDNAKTSLEDYLSQTRRLLKKDVKNVAKHFAEQQKLSKEDARRLRDELLGVFF